MLLVLKHHPCNVHVSGVFSWTIVLRFKSKNEKSAFIKSTSFKIFDSEVPSFHCHHLLTNLSCKSASKPLNAISARSAVCFLQPILQLSKKSSGPPFRWRFLCCIYKLRMYTNTARSIEAERRLCSEAMTSGEVGLLQNVWASRKWTPFSSHFLSDEFTYVVDKPKR